MLLVLFPVPYVDATDATSFPRTWQRALVGAAGIMVEMALAAVAMLVWIEASPGAVRAVAFNVMLIGGVSTLLFNGNPLLRFDGYYVLCDLIGIPNLARAVEPVRSLPDPTPFVRRRRPAQSGRDGGGTALAARLRDRLHRLPHRADLRHRAVSGVALSHGRRASGRLERWIHYGLAAAEGPHPRRALAQAERSARPCGGGGGGAGGRAGVAAVCGAGPLRDAGARRGAAAGDGAGAGARPTEW